MAHVLFDVNGTLLDPRALTASWDGAPGALGLSVLDQTAAQAMVDTVTGDFRPFTDYLRAALRLRAELARLGAESVEDAMRAAAALPPYPDAADALARLRLGGHTPTALTNSGADAARAALGEAGLLDHLHAVVSVEAVRAYKPDPRVYAHALAVLDTPAGETWLVAGHWWDVWGAKRAGLRTAWVGRDEGALLETVPEPDVRAVGLVEAVDGIAAAA